MSKKSVAALFGSFYSPPEFDIELCSEVIEQIRHKTAMGENEARTLGVAITTSIGHICSAFECGFIDEIDARVGNGDYAIRVYMSKDNQKNIN
jgi:hypothetical protein